MAVRKPLVFLDDNTVAELPASDTIPSTSSIDGGAAATIYVAVEQEIDGGNASG